MCLSKSDTAYTSISRGYFSNAEDAIGSVVQRPEPQSLIGTHS